MTYKGHLKAANRAFDHLYDPLFVAADIKDIQRENVSALIRTAPVNIYPVYANMFTDLPQCPRNLCALQQNPLPVNPSFGGEFVFLKRKCNLKSFAIYIVRGAK